MGGFSTGSSGQRFVYGYADLLRLGFHGAYPGNVLGDVATTLRPSVSPKRARMRMLWNITPRNLCHCYT